MVLIENRKLADGSELQIAHEIKPHKAKLIKRLPGARHNYKPRNGAGGRKCMFSQAKEYKRKAFQPVSIWHGWRKRQEAMALRTALVAKLEARRWQD